MSNPYKPQSNDFNAGELITLLNDVKAARQNEYQRLPNKFMRRDLERAQLSIQEDISMCDEFVGKLEKMQKEGYEVSVPRTRGGVHPDDVRAAIKKWDDSKEPTRTAETNKRVRKNAQSKPVNKM